MNSLTRHLLIRSRRFLLSTRQLTSEVNLSKDFEKAKADLESSSVDVDNETKLKLYGLFKQASAGVCTTSKPGLTDFVGRAKWSAWSSLGQMSKDDAQKQYVDVVQSLLKSSIKGLSRWSRFDVLFDRSRSQRRSNELSIEIQDRE